MRITYLYVRNFRNIKEQEFTFHDRMNVFFGNNAQGKTNLCEAIALCMGPSFRGSRISSYLPFNLDNSKEKCVIRMKFFTDSMPIKENVIEFTIENGKKEILYNGISLKSAMELYGILKYVVFIPEHLNLIKGIPEMRREYMDRVAMMQTPVHLKKLSRYNKALKNKNNILIGYNFNGDFATIPPEISLQLESFNNILSAEGLNVTYGRLKYFEHLKQTAGYLYQDLTGIIGGEMLTMEYYSSVFNRRDLTTEEIKGLYDSYFNKLQASLPDELKRKCTQLGVHRDDIIFYLDGREAKEFGSQGQQRSIALVLKLAEAELIRRQAETPIMILDDILSELDSGRQSFVLKQIVNSQVFITCCNLNDIKNIDNCKVWEVEEGKFGLI